MDVSCFGTKFKLFIYVVNVMYEKEICECVTNPLSYIDVGSMDGTTAHQEAGEERLHRGSTKHHHSSCRETKTSSSEGLVKPKYSTCQRC